MNYPQQPPKAPMEDIFPASDLLTRALGERHKLATIKQKMNATYPPPPAPGKKVFSSKPREITL